VRGSVEKAILDARAYGKQLEAYKRSADPAAGKPRANLTLEALIPATRRERPVILSGNSVDDIASAIKFGVDNRLNVVVAGGTDADKAADKLKAQGVGVIFSNVLGMPFGSEAYDRNYSAPKRIFDAGIKFCIATSDTPNLTLHAGIAAAYGLPKEEALKAITLYPAQILGVEKDLGSIEPGKLADLVITDGDPIDFHTQIKRVFVNGVEAPLVSRHSQLYNEFKRKK